MQRILQPVRPARSRRDNYPLISKYYGRKHAGRYLKEGTFDPSWWRTARVFRLLLSATADLKSVNNDLNTMTRMLPLPLLWSVSGEEQFYFGGYWN